MLPLAPASGQGYLPQQPPHRSLGQQMQLNLGSSATPIATPGYQQQQTLPSSRGMGALFLAELSQPPPQPHLAGGPANVGAWNRPTGEAWSDLSVALSQVQQR